MTRKADPEAAPRTPRPSVPRSEEGTNLQRHLLDLQRQAGNAAVSEAVGGDGGAAPTVQRHTLDPDNADA